LTVKQIKHNPNEAPGEIIIGYSNLFLTGVCLIMQIPAFAQNVRVAAAANLQSVIEVLQKDFKQKTGISIEPIVGSSGKLVAQISNGAPFDVFLSADMSFPETLFKGGFADQTTGGVCQGQS
jgi:molybdate transport system substrate-binding protein